MRTTLLISILTFIYTFSIAACDGGFDSNTNGQANPAPKLTATDPAINDNSVMLGNAITAEFDKKMNAASAATFVVFGNKTGKRSGVYTGGGSIPTMHSN